MDNVGGRGGRIAITGPRCKQELACSGNVKRPVGLEPEEQKDSGH